MGQFNPGSFYYNQVMQSVELKQLLEQAELVGQQLTQIKRDIEKNVNSTHYPDVSASEYIERAIKLRLAFRSLAEGIEMNRNIVQNQKERIEKRKIFLQGLHYYKTTITDKIKQCEIDVININQYSDKTIEVNDWNQKFSEKEREIVQKLEEKKNGLRIYEKLIADKLKKEAEIKEKKQLYERVLPSQAKKILSQVQQTSKYFNIEEYDQFDGISNHDLSIIYDKINPLRSHKVVQIKYSKDQFQEIQVIICKNDYRYYKQAVVNKINISDNDIKLTFAYIAPHFNKVVIGLDRRQDFTNEEVFQRLVNNEPIRPIFIAPQNQLERNINAKYVRLDWIDNLFLTGIINPQGFFELIKQRIFCLKLTNYIAQNMKKMLFFFPLNTQHENPLPNSFKKIVTGSFEKVTFEAFLKSIHQPQWLQKYIPFFENLENEMLSQAQDSNKASFINFLNILKIQEIMNPTLHNYYKGSLSIHQNVLEFFLIIPLSYPKQKSVVKILEWRRKKEDDKRPAILDIACKFQASVQAKILPDRVLLIQRAVNQQISDFFKGQQANNPFRILIQINRLLTLLGELNQRKN